MMLKNLMEEESVPRELKKANFLLTFKKVGRECALNCGLVPQTSTVCILMKKDNHEANKRPLAKKKIREVERLSEKRSGKTNRLDFTRVSNNLENMWIFFFLPQSI